LRRPTGTEAGWAEKMIEQRYPITANWRQSINCEALRGGPRWPKLAMMMNLPAKLWGPRAGG